MPIFAFANAGVSLEGMSFGSLFEPIPIGIALGLFLGKQAGGFGFSLAAVKRGLAKLPSDINWRMIYGTSVLCGIGFTMSLFISTLAFDSSITDDAASARIGILVGSFISAIVGYLILSFYIKNDPD